MSGGKMSEGGKALTQIAQRNCGCPIPGGVQSQVGWDPEQPKHSKGWGAFKVSASLSHSLIDEFLENISGCV